MSHTTLSVEARRMRLCSPFSRHRPPSVDRRRIQPARCRAERRQGSLEPDPGVSVAPCRSGNPPACAGPAMSGPAGRFGVLRKRCRYGFKSFAGRVELEFKQGIAGIVGPNGVGKSNISDAIRWAMGEQSPRILRGSRMQDVIFSGAAGRRPLGYAEVVLVFDNSDHFLNVDYDEVTVARRVYRSGESEYLLNGVQCRLRDVQDLFSGTGLGREAYSVVEQGKIDAVLSARPEDRRAVFDEAAGITKYRLRKRDAERRLVEVRADQLRVSDVAAEIARQLPVLRAQADQAVACRGLSDELRR